MAKKERQAKISFSYHRMWEQKLSQVYHLLVPTDNQIVSADHCITDKLKEVAYENSGDIYEGVFRSAEGEQNDWQSG
ncbi:MAG: hypothetical protein ACR2KZ_08580 [Segetibacter sp.]